MKKKFPKVLVLVLALMLISGVVASASADTTTNSNQGVFHRGFMMGRQNGQSVIQVVSDLTGLSVSDIRSQQSQGKSLAAIAESKGVSEQTVIDKVVAACKTSLDKLKADNKITDSQYNDCVANLESKVKAKLESTDAKSGAKGGFKLGGSQSPLQVISDLTGLSVADIQSQRAEGKSLAAIAESKGVSEQTIIDKLVADAKANLDKLKADGKITDTQYNDMISRMSDLGTKVKTMLESTASIAGGKAIFKAAMGQSPVQVVSDFTGLSVTDIQSQRAEGKSLAAIAESKGVSEQTLIDKIVADRTSALDKLKADGKITATQYDNLVSNLEAKVKAEVERTATGPDGSVRGNGWGKGMGRGCWQNQATSTDNSANSSI